MAVQNVGKGAQERDEETASRAWFNLKVLNGSTRSAVRNITNQEGGGVVLSDDKCPKTGQLVIEVLWGKHPDLAVPLPMGRTIWPLSFMSNAPLSVPECCVVLQDGSVS